MVAISAALRQAVLARAGGYCEYCHAPIAVVVEFEIDHIVPVAVGGETALENLCVACGGYNRFKAAYQDGIDPETGPAVPLFDPRVQEWPAHFEWHANRVRLIGLTSAGRATVHRLRMNREQMQVARRLWLETGLFPPGNG
ncbi:MAG: HNH endonuclease [Anaerolineae bacterium]|nr:HNH endonuclease [Anaerolineae bacterium]